MTKLWGKPSGMWTQMVLNFHIFKFHTTRFSHITHVTPKTPFPHPIWNFLHLQFHEQLEESHGCTTCQPTAPPWQDPIFFYSTVFCAYFIASCHYYLQRKQERNSKRHSPQPCLVSITFLCSLRLRLHSCFCFTHAIASQIYPSMQISVSFQVSSAF